MFKSFWKPFHTQIYKLFIRMYSYKRKQKTIMQNMVHQETLRYINPYSRIIVETDLPLKVNPASVFDYPNGNALIAQLLGDHVKNCTGTIKVDVSENERLVNIYVKKTTHDSKFSCDLKVPIRAEVIINAKDLVSVTKLNGDTIQVKSQANIYANSINATNVSLCGESNIFCKGTLLARHTEIYTECGNISLDNLNGGDVSCKTKSGNINVNSCYTDRSKFETDTGSLELKNVHKQCKVHVYKSGNLTMTGVHGNINVNIKSGTMNLQLSELEGCSTIRTGELEIENVNISENIEKNSSIFINAKKCVVDDSLTDINILPLSEEDFPPTKNKLESNKSQLFICSKSPNGIHLKKQSWSDVLLQSMGNKFKD